MTMDENIDKMLKQMSNGNALYMFDEIENHLGISDSSEQLLIIDQMEYKGLINEFGDTRRSVFRISPYGLELLTEYGGWINFLNVNETEHRELVRIRKENEDYQKRVQSYNTKINLGLLITGVISAILVVYGIFQTDKTNTLEKKLELTTKEIDSLSTVIHDQSNLLKTKDKEILELKDSLK